MDSAAFDATLAAQSFRFIERVNRFLGGTRIAWEFVRSEAIRKGLNRPLRILDIGSGSCDIPLSICRRATLAGIDVSVTCVEISSYALDLARSALENHPQAALNLCQQSVFEHQPEVRYDVAMGSMFFHHFPDDRICDLITHLTGIVDGRILINDLGRCRTNYVGAWLLCLAESPGVRHDAMLSVKRGFLPQDIQRLVQSLPGVTARVRWRWPFRVAAIVEHEHPKDKPSKD